MTTPPEEPVPKESLIRFHADDLPRADRRALADRIDGDPASRAALAEWDRQDAAMAAIYAPLAEEALPPRYAALLDEARTAPAARRGAARPRSGILLLAVLGPVLGALIGWGASRALWPAPPETAAAAAQAFRIYATDATRPVELSAAEVGPLAAWASARLGQAIAPPDLGRAGLALLGGRVLPGPMGAAAFFLYQTATGQRAALYVTTRCTAGPDRPTAFDTAGLGGFWWRSHSLCIAAVGSPGDATLHRVATLAYDALL